MLFRSRNEGLIVQGLAAIFTYGFEIAVNNFEKANCEFFTLSDYDALLEQGVDSNYIKESDIVSLKEWKSDPENWKN